MKTVGTSPKTEDALIDLLCAIRAKTRQAPYIPGHGDGYESGDIARHLKMDQKIVESVCGGTYRAVMGNNEWCGRWIPKHGLRELIPYISHGSFIESLEAAGIEVLSDCYPGSHQCGNWCLKVEDQRIAGLFGEYTQLLWVRYQGEAEMRDYYNSQIRDLRARILSAIA